MTKPAFAETWAVHRWHHLWLGSKHKHKHEEHSSNPPPPLEVWNGASSDVIEQENTRHQETGRPSPNSRLWAAGGPRYHTHRGGSDEWLGDGPADQQFRAADNLGNNGGFPSDNGGGRYQPSPVRLRLRHPARFEVRPSLHSVGPPPKCLDKALPARTWRLRGLCAKNRGPYQDKSDRVEVVHQLMRSTQVGVLIGGGGSGRAQVAEATSPLLFSTVTLRSPPPAGMCYATTAQSSDPRPLVNLVQLVNSDGAAGDDHHLDHQPPPPPMPPSSP